jgi:hypothetical protein
LFRFCFLNDEGLSIRVFFSTFIGEINSTKHKDKNNQGANALNRKANGRIINLFNKEPLVIAHKTGISLEETNPEALCINS